MNKLKSFKKRFRNIELKLISLTIATILWIMVTGKDYRYGDFSIPLEYKGLPENLIIVSTGADNSEIKDVTVRIRASETIIKTLNESYMFMRIDVSALGEGHRTIRLNEDMVMGKPPGAEITDIFPTSLELNIESMLIKSSVVVNTEILGKPAENFEISQIVCDPPAVSLKGPKSAVEKVEKVSTTPVKVEGLSSGIRQDLHIVPPNPRVTVIPENVNLSIQIREKFIIQAFRDIRVTLRNTEYTTRVNPRTLSVWVQGPISQIQKITARNIKAIIELKGDEPKRKDLKMEPQLECSPRDSFPDVKLEHFSQNYVNVYLTDTKIIK